SKILDYRKILSSIYQYNRNITHGKNGVELNETILGEIDNLLNEAKGYATGQSDSELRALTAESVKNIYNQALWLANSRFGGRYIFSGNKTDTIPFSKGGESAINGGTAEDIVFGLSADATDVTITIKNSSDVVVRTIVVGDGVTPGDGGSAGLNTVSWDGLDDGGAACPDGAYTFSIAADNAGNEVDEYETYHGSNDDKRIIVGEGIEISINADGDNIFSNIFETLSRLQAALEADPYNPSDCTERLDSILNAIDQINIVRSEDSAIYTQLELTENKFNKFKLNFENMLSGVEDADMAKAIIELQVQEVAYQASLAVSASIIQPTLINFLR
ncbi:MAG: flagellar hook-associated protein FlgL, partial [Thermodesulfobacteriota bacterium]|nr:flagellar hook-associated protein FlgL [Thermodesulfobacteriota bacterium]